MKQRATYLDAVGGIMILYMIYGLYVYGLN